MIRTLLARLHALRPPVRSLVFLFWIYSFTVSMTTVFIQIFLYEKFSSVSLNIMATICNYTGILFGFSVAGYVASTLRINIKRGFLASFVVMGATLLLLSQSSNMWFAYTAMFLLGIGVGLFWLTIHTFELTETRNEERDFYSSVLSAGSQLCNLLGPAFATLLIYISNVLLGWGNFTLLFMFAPLTYLLGFFCFSSIQNYYPKPLEWADVVHYFSDRKNQVAQIYLAGTGFQQIFFTTIPPLVVFLILGSALKVGIYQTMLAVFATVCILMLAQYRTVGNRLPILGFSTLGLVVMTAWFGNVFTFNALLLYSGVAAVLYPLISVSAHVIDLQTLESIGRANADFYPTMIMRDVSSWFFRCVGGLLFLAIIQHFGSDQKALSVGLYCLAGALACMYLGAHLLVKRTTRA